MSLIKLRGWQLMLVKAIALPVLKKLSAQIKAKADASPAEWDDVIAGAFETVVAFLESPEAFEET